jgi:hypothetical protein
MPAAMTNADLDARCKTGKKAIGQTSLKIFKKDKLWQQPKIALWHSHVNDADAPSPLLRACTGDR